jgi:hypothetical protein
MRIESYQRARKKIKAQKAKLKAIEAAWLKETGHRFNYWDDAWRCAWVDSKMLNSLFDKVMLKLK